MDFGFDSALPPATASTAQPAQPSVTSNASKPAGGAAGLGSFADLMAASAQPNLINDDPFAASSRPHSSEPEPQPTLHQPAPKPVQPLELGFEPRSLHGAFDAASAASDAAPPEEHPFGAPPAFPTFPPAAAGPPVPPAMTHELSFNGEPAPEWDLPAAPAAPAVQPQIPVAVAPSDLNAAPAASAASSALALVPSALRPSTAAAAAGPGVQAAKPASRAGSARAGGPTGFVLEDLLAHAVESMRIKNAAKTSLAGRPPTQAPSLIVSSASALHCLLPEANLMLLPCFQTLYLPLLN